MGLKLKKILVIENNNYHWELFQNLKPFSTPWQLKRVKTYDEALKALSNLKFDLIISEHPQSLGLPEDQILKLKKRYPLPVIILTCHSSQVLAIEAIKMGADDYVLKNKPGLSKLPQIIHKTLKGKSKKHKSKFLKTPLLSIKLKNITQILQQPALQSEKYRLLLENELEGLKGMLKSWITPS